MDKPFEYYHNNVYGMLCLLDVMRENKVNKIVFSSTAATYGEPKCSPIMELDETSPTNTYGETKLAMEKMRKWFDQAYGTKYVSLRYFNAAGAYDTGEIGEDHHPETHLIPLILQVPLGKRDKIYMFGDDYPTEDGTCVRDYIHVVDLAKGHVKAIENLKDGINIYNLGTGRGTSVLELVKAFMKVNDIIVPYEIVGRRPGDIASCFADASKAEKELGRKAELGIEEMVRDAWKFEDNNR